ncbi:hypothetical protein E5S70_17575 [Ensifer adhaerens]|uniref:hypothetical protein n=1 Tax=Ensifer canadensis TaxID=555315 RepID=UPI00148F586E|nr:hypothetical protein [Ensifer canadensis]NOV17864.1 hypothetical protein [Ensifer canadensis]
MMLVNDTEKAARERRVTLAHYHRTDRDIDAQASLLASQKKANRLNAKAAGVPSSQLDHLLKSFKADDQQKPVDKLKRDMENLAYLGLIPDPSVKGDLFARVDRVDNEGMIKAKGFFAGLNGLDRISGYDAGSVDDKMFLESYDAGKAEYDAEIPDILARVQAAATNEEPAADPGDSDPFDAASVH